MQHQPRLSCGSRLTLAAAASESERWSSDPVQRNCGSTTTTSFMRFSVVVALGLRGVRQQAAWTLRNCDTISILVTNVPLPFPDILWQGQGSPGWHVNS